jgi:uncharacterized protein YoxC
VETFFDVSFGAELTTSSYIHFLREHSGDRIDFFISQPCAALVTYIEIFQPSLLPRLIPAHSPMLHTIKMLREFYPKYRNYKVVVLSPCAAKRREFAETGLGDYNVTFTSLKSYFAEKKINLASFPRVDYEGPAAERGMRYPIPGGLLDTAERYSPGIRRSCRQLEGVPAVYTYLSNAADLVKAGSKRLPKLLDCLSCEKGCIAGPGTGNADVPIDELCGLINEREGKEEDANTRKWRRRAVKKYNALVETYWRPGLYTRSYRDLSRLNTVKELTDAEYKAAYAKLRKTTQADIYDCGSCGYGSCKAMAKALVNGLSKVENCHHYNLAVLEENKKQIDSLDAKAKSEVKEALSALSQIEEMMNKQSAFVAKQGDAVSRSTEVVNGMLQSLTETSEAARSRLSVINQMTKDAVNGRDSMNQTITAVNGISTAVDGITGAIKTISGIAANTNILAMNAAIEAAHAGSAGAGFSVVADEIRKLSETTAANSKAISQILSSIVTGIHDTTNRSGQTSALITGIADSLQNFSQMLTELLTALDGLSRATGEITSVLTELRDASSEVEKSQNNMLAITGNIEKTMFSIS